MKERPIIFSGPMVRAILEGRKTQTRRVVKPQPPNWCRYEVNGNQSHALCFGPSGECVPPTPVSTDHRLPCPHGQPGDRLWVRESFSYYEHPELYDCIRYKADGHCQKPDFGRMTEMQCGWFELNCDGCGCADHRWRPPIHMPRWASRITLEITDIRVERLGEISREDAIAEGAPPSHPSIDCVSRDFGYADFSRSWFAQLWETIHGPGSWYVNPWVWVIEFERVKG